MYEIKFTKIRNNHNRIRTDVIKGITHELPQIGQGFVMLSEGLDFGTRYIQTSPIKNIKTIDNKHQIFTESGSVYEIEVLGEVSEEN